jgi:hypothetical protein
MCTKVIFHLKSTLCRCKMTCFQPKNDRCMPASSCFYLKTTVFNVQLSGFNMKSSNCTPAIIRFQNEIFKIAATIIGF